MANLRDAMDRAFAGTETRRDFQVRGVIRNISADGTLTVDTATGTMVGVEVPGGNQLPDPAGYIQFARPAVDRPDIVVTGGGFKSHQFAVGEIVTILVSPSTGRRVVTGGSALIDPLEPSVINIFGGGVLYASVVNSGDVNEVSFGFWDPTKKLLFFVDNPEIKGSAFGRFPGSSSSMYVRPAHFLQILTATASSGDPSHDYRNWEGTTQGTRMFYFIRFLDDKNVLLAYTDLANQLTKIAAYGFVLSASDPNAVVQRILMKKNLEFAFPFQLVAERSATFSLHNATPGSSIALGRRRKFRMVCDAQLVGSKIRSLFRDVYVYYPTGTDGSTPYTTDTSTGQSESLYLFRDLDDTETILETLPTMQVVTSAGLNQLGGLVSYAPFFVGSDGSRGTTLLAEYAFGSILDAQTVLARKANWGYPTPSGSVHMSVKASVGLFSVQSHAITDPLYQVANRRDTDASGVSGAGVSVINGTQNTQSPGWRIAGAEFYTLTAAGTSPIYLVGRKVEGGPAPAEDHPVSGFNLYTDLVLTSAVDSSGQRTTREYTIDVGSRNNPTGRVQSALVPGREMNDEIGYQAAGKRSIVTNASWDTVDATTFTVVLSSISGVIWPVTLDATQVVSAIIPRTDITKAKLIPAAIKAGQFSRAPWARAFTPTFVFPAGPVNRVEIFAQAFRDGSGNL